MTAPLLEIERLRVAYGAAEVVRKVSLAIAPGECLGIVGESGSGKSQTFLAGLGIAGPRARVSGMFRFRGEDLLGLDRRALNRVRGSRITMVFQDPLTGLAPHLTIGAQIAEPLRKHCGLGSDEAMAQAREWLVRVRIPDAGRRLRQYPHELSGGMRQRVMIAMAMAPRPDLIIADEPTTALDVTVQAEILDLIDELCQGSTTAIALITHDMGVIARLADRVCVMQAGAIVEVGEAAALFAAPRAEYTRGLLAHSGSAGATRRPLADGGPAVLETSGLEVAYRIRTKPFARATTLRAVDGISIAVRAGETLGIVGESGSGKSTLARAAMRLVAPSAGTVAFLGLPLPASDRRALRAARKDFQIVFQDPFASLDPRLTIGVSIAEPLRVHRPDIHAIERRRRVATMLEEVGLSADVAERYPHELSGGQNQRVAVARAMILEPRLVVCDEAVSALDVSARSQVLALLARFQQKLGAALLFISHDLAVVRRISHRVAVLYLGRVVEQGSAEAIFADPRHPYTRRLLAATLTPDPARERHRPRQPDRGDPPSSLDPEAQLGFLAARRGELPAGYRPALIEVAPGHYVAEHDPA